ncbi:MAG: hypothetical protein AB7T10_06040 [bacterium]
MAIRICIFINLLWLSAHLCGYTLTSEKTVILGDTVHMSAGVILLTDDFTVNTDTALFFRRDSVVVMPRKLVVTRSDSTVINAESGVYFMRGKVFNLFSQTTDKSGSFLIESDSLNILLNESLFIYTINPVLYFDSRRSFASGDTIEYSFADDTMRLFNKSIFNKNEGYTIESDTTIIMPDDSIYTFYHSCIVRIDSIQLETDSLVYTAKKDYAKTYGRTIIENDNITLSADTVKMLFKNDSLDFMIAYRNVDFRAIEENEDVSILCDSLESKLEQNKMKKTFFYLITKSELETREENDIKE